MANNKSAPDAGHSGAHTPGPWSACRDGDCSCKTVSCGDHPIANIVAGDWGDEYASLRLVGDSLNRTVEPFMDRITYGSVGEETAKANARLIAAAPDLLAVCQKLDAWWLEEFPDGPEGSREWAGGIGRLSEDTIEIWRGIRAAIAKAEGRQS